MQNMNLQPRVIALEPTFVISSIWICKRPNQSIISKSLIIKFLQSSAGLGPSCVQLHLVLRPLLVFLQWDGSVVFSIPIAHQKNVYPARNPHMTQTQPVSGLFLPHIVHFLLQEKYIFYSTIHFYHSHDLNNHSFRIIFSGQNAEGTKSDGWKSLTCSVSRLFPSARSSSLTSCMSRLMKRDRKETMSLIKWVKIYTTSQVVWINTLEM